MKISRIKISNLFTFPYISGFHGKKGVIFDARERNNFNIIIGPNGSGKSNFLHIISQTFRFGLVNHYFYDKSILENNEKNKFKQVIQVKKKKIKNMPKHYLSGDKPSKIGITLKLNQNDFENIAFMSKHTILLNNILKKYSKLDISFSDYHSYDLIFEHEIYLEFLVNSKNGSFKIANYKFLSNKMRFILFYIQNIELIQICINIFNDFEKLPEQKKLYSLKNTFALLESERNILYDNTGEYQPFLVDSVAARSEDIELHKEHKFASVTVGYDLFIIKLIKLAKEKLLFEGKNYTLESPKVQLKALTSSYYFRETAYFIKKILKLDLDIKISDKGLEIVFVNKYGNLIYFDQLSSGEKSILMILIALFGYDLSSGLFIIDEIELHLHPYLLKKMVDLLKEIGAKLNIQFICSTHSPILIDEQSINNVYKFSFVDGQTNIHYPMNSIRDKEATLIHILKFEHIAKIFFMNKILMVEGETDEYFWRFFLSYLSKKPEFKGKLDNFEILNINGKGSYSRWSNFLKKFGIESYFIGDWDNVVGNGIVDYQEMDTYINLTKQCLDSDHIKKEKFYVRIIETIKKFFPEKYEYIKNKIQLFYDQGIFILQEGNLEVYLGLKRKGLEETIRFCNNNFYSWLNNKNYKKHFQEFKEIVAQIFKLKKRDKLVKSL
ncbi:MAG TPA: AAA family ATPase [Candidatus Absconditabacterales bacterium]|nr:AAA family ATPase [Candidatus Absconditabacterales bacterium]HOQ79322.1 AAA family ATPase [Candidatus Absconditabacterales bacterium]HPK28120.1 AAA family ATPase [Candidatus Absconditabacterales bacterium]